MKNIINALINWGGIIMSRISGYLSTFFAAAASLMYRSEPRHTYSSTAFQQREKSIRCPKDPVKKAAIERRRKAKRLSQLGKPKRRAVYYHNLRHPVKMYA